LLAWTVVVIRRNPEHAAEHVDAAVLAELSLPANSERASPMLEAVHWQHQLRYWKQTTHSSAATKVIKFQCSSQLLVSSVRSGSNRQKSAYHKQ